MQVKLVFKAVSYSTSTATTAVVAEGAAAGRWGVVEVECQQAAVEVAAEHRSCPCPERRSLRVIAAASTEPVLQMVRLVRRVRNHLLHLLHNRRVHHGRRRSHHSCPGLYHDPWAAAMVRGHGLHRRGAHDRRHILRHAAPKEPVHQKAQKEQDVAAMEPDWTGRPAC